VHNIHNDVLSSCAIRTRSAPSWKDGAAKQAIVSFVTRVTKEGGPDFVQPDEHIATFDNHGTTWTKPPQTGCCVSSIQKSC
jgi:hypothetical protein